MNICYIFGSLEVNEFNYSPDENDFIIAADKGFLNTEKFGLKPSYIVGDFDSLEYVPTGKNVIKYPVMKDDTDLLLAIKIGFDNGFKEFRIFGCIGGERLDHTIATIQAGAYIKSLGGNAMFYDGNTSLMLLENETFSLSTNSKGIISIFSYSESACVSIKGLLYELDNQTITHKHPLGVSNEFVGKPSKITIHSGTVLLIIKEN